MLAGAVQEWTAVALKTPPDEVRRLARVVAAMVTGLGEEPDYTNPETLNLIAQAAALASFTQGGCTLLGLHFQATHPGLR